MTKHTFKLSDVTEDTRELARTALGYDWNYFADAETILFGSTDETAFRMQNMSPGSGISSATGVVYKANATYAGDMIRTEILIDVTGLSPGGAAADIIGDNDAANCHIGQITAALNGTIIAGEMRCFETPTSGGTVEPDIDLYSASEATGTENAAIGDLTETALLNTGADWTLTKAPMALTALPAADEYLYLVSSGGGDTGAYTGGIFLITLWGHSA